MHRSREPGARPAARAQLSPALPGQPLVSWLPTPVGPGCVRIPPLSAPLLLSSPTCLWVGLGCSLCSREGEGLPLLSLLYKGKDKQTPALLPAESCPGEETVLPSWLWISHRCRGVYGLLPPGEHSQSGGPAVRLRGPQLEEAGTDTRFLGGLGRHLETR